MPSTQARDWEAKLDAFAARFRAETNLPGISLATTAGGERVCVAAGIGRNGAPLDAAARYELGAAVQLPLALLALELARSGRLALDAPLGEYLPELRGSTRGSIVRVAHLLSHTSGHRGVSLHDRATRQFDRAALLAYVRAAPQLFPPGAVHSFDHSNVALLGEIVQRVVGRAAEAAVRDEILAPLGLARCADGADGDAAGGCAGRFELDGQSGCFRPAADAANEPPLGEAWHAAFSPATFALGELLTLAEAIMGSLPRSTVEQLATAVVALPAAIGGPLRELLPCAFGSGVARFRDGFCGSASLTRGQCVAVRFDVARRTGLAVGVNATVPYLRDIVLAAMSRELGGSPPPLERPLLPLPLPELAGVYAGPGGGSVEARLDGERLVCELRRDGSPFALRAVVAVDDDGRPALSSAPADLALAFFLVPHDGGVGLMLGASAYKRVTGAARPAHGR